jgi:hypothetical protein
MVRCGFDKDTISVWHLAKTALRFCFFVFLQNPLADFATFK